MQSLALKSPAVIGNAQAKQMKEEFLHTIKGGEMFVSRDYARDDLPIANDTDIHYELEISPDGKTATVTVTQDKQLNSMGLRDAEYRIGKSSVSQRTTIDLTQEMPVVTNVTFAQTFTPDEIQLDEA